MPRTNKTKERRSSIRASHVLSLKYRITKSSRKKFDKSWKLTMTEDMSSDGISFYSDYEICKGDILDIHVVMSGVLDIYKGKAEVARVRKSSKSTNYFVGVKTIPTKTKKRPAKRFNS